MWSGLVVSCVNSLIVCVIGLHTSQYGFIPANVFCICINAFNLRTWLKAQTDASQLGTEAGSVLTRTRAAISSAEGMGVVSFRGTRRRGDQKPHSVAWGAECGFV